MLHWIFRFNNFSDGDFADERHQFSLRSGISIDTYASLRSINRQKHVNMIRFPHDFSLLLQNWKNSGCKKKEYMRVSVTRMKNGASRGNPVGTVLGKRELIEWYRRQSERRCVLRCARGYCSYGTEQYDLLYDKRPRNGSTRSTQTGKCLFRAKADDSRDGDSH